ncbi:MAG: hypothetical protein JSV83_03245, partial [Desulfobacterales bacterium]
MRLLECEAKEILNKYQIVTPSGSAVASVGKLDVKPPLILKAQVPIGGRGKSGGILEASTNKEAKIKIEQLLSTWVRGYKSRKILMEEKLDIDREFFMAITYDTVAKA